MSKSLDISDSMIPSIAPAVPCCVCGVPYHFPIRVKCGCGSEIYYCYGCYSEYYGGYGIIYPIYGKCDSCVRDEKIEEVLRNVG